jgi:hypothetical protein
MATEKFKLMFNAKNGTLLGHLPKGMNTFGLDPDEVKIKTVSYDPDKEIYIGTYADGSVKKITEVDSGKAFIDEEMLNAGVSDKIQNAYPVHRQLNIIIDMLEKSDIPNTPEFQEMMSYIKDLRERNKARKTEYKNNTDAYFFADKATSEIDRKKRMGQA